MLPGLREDALSSTEEGFELRLSLPWIRSLPLAGMSGLRVSLDGGTFSGSELRIRMADQSIAGDAVGAQTDTWWHLQDRLVLAGPARVSPGAHAVSVDFQMLIPNLSAGADTPLTLPFHLEATLDPDRRVSPDVAGDVGTNRSV